MRRIILSVTLLVGLAACSDPLGGMTRFGDLTTSDATASVAPAASEGRQTGGGLFGRLLNRSPEDPTNAAIEAALADAGVVAADAASDGPTEVVQAAAPAPEPARGGLFGFFRRAPSSQAAPQDSDEAEVTEVAAAPAPQEAANPPRGLAGLFRRAPGGNVPPRTGPDASDVDPGTQMAFGEVARVCGMQRRQFGTEVGSGGGFDLFDSNPASTAPRPFYVTGFSDGCARTFTGAVAVAGDVRSHEFVRYQPSNERISYTAADNAYEALKASVCRVGRGQPCGAQTDRLNRTTQFITVYSFFGGTFSAVPTKWAQILLHDGEVLAVSIKDG